MPFEILNQNEYLLVKLSGECDGKETPSLSTEFKLEMKRSGLKRAIVQCADCGAMYPNFIRELVAIYREIHANNGQLRLVGANEGIQATIQVHGVDQVLINKMSLRGALVDFGLAPSKEIDVNFVNPFLNATMKVFKIQCFMELRAQKPFVKNVSDPLLMGDVSGIISVVSNSFSGTLAISLSETIFLQVVQNMLGENYTGVRAQHIDLIGELANMILGQAKIELGHRGYSVEMALPSCIWGRDHKIKHYGGGMCMVLPFDTEFGSIYLEIMTNNNLLQQIKAA